MTYQPNEERDTMNDVWVAIYRHGIPHHLLEGDGTKTLCGRTTAAGGETIPAYLLESLNSPTCMTCATTAARESAS